MPLPTNVTIFSFVGARPSSERTTHVVPGFDTRAHAMSRAGEHAAAGGDVAVIQEVRGLAEELTNLRQENSILQGNFDEVRFRAAFRASPPGPTFDRPGLTSVCFAISSRSSRRSTRKSRPRTTASRPSTTT